MKRVYSFIILCMILTVRIMAQNGTSAQTKDWEADEEDLRSGCSYVRSSQGEKKAVLFYSIKKNKMFVAAVDLLDLKGGIHRMVYIDEESPYEPACTNARLYDPIAGRFYSPDPILATEGGPLDFNPYVYARNNPLSYVDQDGELAWFVPLIAAAVGGAFNVASNWDNIHNIGQGFAFFGMGAAASALSSLGAVAAGFTFAGAATIGAGNSILSQGFNNGWNHINWAQVGLSTGMSILTSYIGGWIGDKLSAPLSNITSGISNSIVREALTGALVNSVTGFSLGTTTSLLMGNNFKTALRDGGTAAGNGFVSGAALGLAKGYIQSRLEKKPMQMHHFATNKNKRYTPQMKAITDKYGLDLNGDWNKELMPHLGRHPNYYHEYVLEQMTQISIIAGKNQNLFLDLYEQNVKMPIRNNPNMLYKNYWLNH